MNFTKQKMLNTLYEARQGNGRSLDDAGSCSYEACAIGCQPGFPDKLRHSGNTVLGLLGSFESFKNWIGHVSQKERFYLQDLQSFHDESENWTANGRRLLKSAVYDFAKLWKLKSPWRAKVVAG